MSCADDVTVDIGEVYQFALSLARDAGRMLNDSMLARCHGGLKEAHIEKESAVDLVTQTDEGKPLEPFHHSAEWAVTVFRSCLFWHLMGGGARPL